MTAAQAVSSGLSAVGLASSVAAALFVVRRRAIYWLGRHGGSLAFPALLITWVAGLALGQVTGRLEGMSLVGAGVLGGVALAARRTPRRRWYPAWTLGDRVAIACWLFVTATLLLNRLYDSDCHDTVMGMFLRGNIPPHAGNDPTQLIAYHVLYDAMAAVVVRGLPLDLELARDLCSSMCVAAVILIVRVLSRQVMRSPAARMLAVPLFLFGFGPTWLLAIGDRSILALHGQTTQSFVDIILRRPQVLAFVVLLLAFSQLIARIPR